VVSHKHLAELFNVKSNAPDKPGESSPAAPNTSVPPDLNTPHSHSHAASIIGGLLGGVAFIALSASLSSHYRRRIRRLLTGGRFPVEEMDDGQKIAKEIMDKEVFWELPTNEKPVEL